MHERRMLLESQIPTVPCRRGKVRDIYDLNEKLLIIATDRISAYDWVLSSGIPDKGRILTAISLMWFDRLDVPNHLISPDASTVELPRGTNLSSFVGRSMVVKKTRVIPIECIVRGYLAGSGWREYQATGMICGQVLPDGLKQAERLPNPIFTPTSKSDVGHDTPMTFQEVCESIGTELADQLREISVSIYEKAAGYAEQKGLILADTKFEFGVGPNKELLLIDEVLTPDSSRYWPAESYQIGSSPPSFDKQFVRDWLDSTDWDKQSPPPEMPQEIIERTHGKYLEAHRKLLGYEFSIE